MAEVVDDTLVFSFDDDVSAASGLVGGFIIGKSSLGEDLGGL